MRLTEKQTYETRNKQEVMATSRFIHQSFALIIFKSTVHPNFTSALTIYYVRNAPRSISLNISTTKQEWNNNHTAERLVNYSKENNKIIGQVSLDVYHNTESQT